MATEPRKMITEFSRAQFEGALHFAKYVAENKIPLEKILRVRVYRSTGEGTKNIWFEVVEKA